MNKSKVFDIVSISITAILITVFAIISKRDVFVIIPLYVSLFVMILSANISRSAFLLGGLNSLLYAAIYFYTDLYATALYAILFSFTIQIYTFISWGKKKYKNATILKKFTKKQLVVFITAIFISIIGLSVFMFLFKSGENKLVNICDSAISLIGIVSSVLAALSYSEYPFFTLLSNVISILLYSFLMIENPIQITYLIFNIFALICSIRAVVHIRKLYKEQNSWYSNTIYFFYEENIWANFYWIMKIKSVLI